MVPTVTEMTFASHGVRCAAWHVPARRDELAGPAGRPCVVMAHGFGGTRDSGLLAFADAFADAGFDAYVFDYRGFGASGGDPRQDVSVRRQRQDYHAAIAAARRVAGVDPDRIALWGTSYSGGHVLAVAEQDPRVAAVVSMTPATDGLAALGQIVRYAGVATLVRATGHGLLDLWRTVTNGPAHHVPVVGQPGATAMISTPGAADGYVAVAGATWRNQVRARAALGVALNRPGTRADRLRCPVLVQVGTDDQVAPPDAARRAAHRARARLLEYPADHFDVYTGSMQERVARDQVAFLAEVLAVPGQWPAARPTG